MCFTQHVRKITISFTATLLELYSNIHYRWDSAQDKIFDGFVCIGI